MAIIGDPTSGLAECGMRLKSKAECGIQKNFKGKMRNDKKEGKNRICFISKAG